jgi:hypothetical protein
LEHVVQSVVQTYYGKSSSERVTASLQNTISSSMDRINAVWAEFGRYLKAQIPFDRIYFESYIYDLSHPSFKIGDGEMIDCLNYLANSGSKFEKTENKLLQRLAAYSIRKPVLFKAVDFMRELYANHRINTTLQDGERGLLLFGAGHAEKLTKLMSVKGIEVEVYPLKHARVQN